MASTLTSSNPVTNTSSSDRSRRKKKKKSSQSQSRGSDSQIQDHAKWKTQAQEHIYSSKLIQALSHVQLTPSSPSAPRRGRAVREAADRVLAVAARGRTRWSRAILTGRIKLKFRKQQKRQQRVLGGAVTAGNGGGTRSRKPRLNILRLKGKSLPAVRVLGRLVPGCRKQPLPVILEEATDYIAALEMQVRAMTAIAELLSGRSGSSSTSNSGAAAAGGSDSAPIR